MKKYLSIIALFAGVIANAQDLTEAQKAALAAAEASQNAQEAVAEPVKPDYWTKSIGFDLGLNQTWMTNWAAGGYPTVSLAAGVDAKANYAQGRTSWNNRIQLNYGLTWSADKPNLVQSATDRIYMESKYDYKMTEKSKWSYSAGVDFRTQFAPAMSNYRLENPEDAKSKWIGDVKSSFFAPAYLNVALGVDYKPFDWLDMSLAPLTGGLVVVGREDLRKNYGMPLINAESGLYKAVKTELGTQFKANVKLTVNEWFNYETQFVFFGNYLGKEYVHEDSEGKKHVTNDRYRINWDNKISFSVAKYFKIALQTWLIYDPSIIYVQKDSRGQVTDTKYGPVQFKEFFSVNFTYTLQGKKK